MAQHPVCDALGISHVGLLPGAPRGDTRVVGGASDLIGKLSDIQVPPAWVIKAARAELARTKHWVDYYNVLTAYYRVLPISQAFVDPSLAPTIVAQYRAAGFFSQPTVVSRESGMSEHTALHELFHHLVYEKGARPKHFQAEQALADAFADAVTREDVQNADRSVVEPEGGR